jgi:hypothetical protein
MDYIRFDRGTYIVSESENSTKYMVDLWNKEATCTCEDFIKNRACEHIDFIFMSRVEELQGRISSNLLDPYIEDSFTLDETIET